MSDQPIRVYVVDDHAVVRHGLRAALEHEDVTVVGEAGTVADGHAGLLATRPDVAIVDLRLPDGNGVTLIRDVRSSAPHVRCIVFTSFADDEAFFHAMMAGAGGFIVKDVDPTELRAAVRRVAEGESLLTPAMLDEVRARASEVPDDELFSDFTPQERRVLGLVSEGCTNREIAATMSLAEKTVRNYVSNILTKMGMRNRTELAAHVVRLAGPSHRH